MQLNLSTLTGKFRGSPPSAIIQTKRYEANFRGLKTFDFFKPLYTLKPETSPCLDNTSYDHQMTVEDICERAFGKSNVR